MKIDKVVSIGTHAVLMLLALTASASHAGSSTKDRKAELQFSYPVQGGTTVMASVFADENNRNRKLVLFEPMLKKTDGNLYQSALESLSNIYGKQRGLFQLSAARVSPDPSLGGNSICWPIHNPSQSFCVFPVKDSGSGKIAAMTVWIK